MFNHEFPLELPSNLEKAITKTFQDRFSAGQQQQIHLSLEKLWQNFTQDRGQNLENTTHYSQIPFLAESYGLYYAPVNVMKLPVILSEMNALGLDFNPQPSDTWLDFGSGPGTLILGASWWFETYLQKQPTFLAAEQGERFLKICQDFFANLNGSRSSLQVHNQALAKTSDFISLIEKKRPKYISFGNSLSEFQLSLPEKAQLLKDLILQSFAHRSSSWLILLEPATRPASRDLLALRQMLLEDSALDGKFQLCLPCLNHRPCGAYANEKDWCHEMYPFKMPQWHQDLGKKAGLKKEELLFSYQVFHIGDSLPVKAGKEFPFLANRIVSQNMKEKGLQKCFVCTSEGKRSFRVLNSKQNEENASFVEAKTGDIFPHLETDEKTNVLSARKI